MKFAAIGLVASSALWSLLNAWSDELIAYYIEPSRPFDEARLPDKPEYTQPRYWAALPGKPSAARLTPTGQPSREAPAPADVFYIHPTSYISGEDWNAPLFTRSRAWEMIDIILGAQASAFNFCCEVYAPHYRQAALSSFMNPNEKSGIAALELAYSDVARAFEVFRSRNTGRPFIIASHSQGTYHALRLLADYVDGQPVQRQMVAAYLVGYWLPLDTFDRTLKSIAPCESAADTGCVVHWSTYGEDGVRREGVPHWYPTGPELSDGKPLLCSNPLSWRRDGGRVSAAEHPGALYVSPGGSVLDDLLNRPSNTRLEALPPLLENWTWAECRDGLLHVAAQDSGPFAELSSSPEQDYHLVDYSLFYQSVRENARERVRSYGAKRFSQR
ncbi:DUF3089 domain-containing protein [Parahaliea mediterranea]|uniref:DUF3089 domain-containing protein n=1 Tax=Parahaliea mediterranea TaxID=651086 RepID=A0A939DI96_9GAMM|nr:DUF3089 domain-containing protein [Parahaliea mediterranea]MBN7798625.1 DUF3089 domain-containing protein [Parahaliea mediterranea]